MVTDLAALEPDESERPIRLGRHGRAGKGLCNAPATVREFFAHCSEPPGWLDLSWFRPGCRMFHGNSRLILAGMVGGVLAESLATSRSKAFFLNGRLRDQGARYLQQNNRHMLEISMPCGMERPADRWTHSVRVRLVHASLRPLLAGPKNGISAELGTPVGAAHVGHVGAASSARLLQHLERLGGAFDEQERRSFMAV